MKSSDTITLGVGDLTVNSVDVGYLGGEVTVTTEVEKVDFTHGTHKTLVKRFVTTLSRSIKAKLAQIDIDTLKMALGIGEVVTNGNNSRLKFGSNWTLPTLTNVKFVHTRADGKKVTVFFPKAQVEPGTSELTFSNENVIMQDITISAVEDTTRTDCPMGLIQVGDSDDTTEWSSSSSGSGSSSSTITASISTVTDETVTYSSSDPHYSLAHKPVLASELTVKSSDGNTTYDVDDDYTVDAINGNIFTTDDTNIASQASLKASYKYVSNATIVDSESVTFSNGTATLAHSPLYGSAYVVVTSGDTTYDLTDDYTVNTSTGVITAVSGGDISSTATVSVQYAYLTSSST